MESHVTFDQASTFMRRCRAKPERMRTLCSRKAQRSGGDCVSVSVEVAAGGPDVEVSEVSMAEGWTGCRFSPAALWLALALAERRSEHVVPSALTAPKALELGCGVALAGLAAHALGFDTTLTDVLPGHLRNLAPRECASLRVRCLDWIEDTGGGAGADSGSPENIGAAADWSRLAREEMRTFDIVLASDVLYEEHHAELLPQVVEHWLRPGGSWLLVFAIRDADMLRRFVRGLWACGLVAPIAEGTNVNEGACAMSWMAACEPMRCEFCRGLDAGCGGRHAGGVQLAALEAAIDAHEGGAILLEGKRPC